MLVYIKNIQIPLHIHKERRKHRRKKMSDLREMSQTSETRIFKYTKYIHKIRGPKSNTHDNFENSKKII